MTRWRKAALATISILVAASAIASFSESYRALYDWATRHGLSGMWAGIWPLQIDVFIAVGELALFVGLADQWSARSRVAAWTVTALGLAVGVAGNVGHTGSTSWTVRGTAAVPPLAAAAALAVGLGVLKRVVAARPQSQLPDAPDAVPVELVPGTADAVPALAAGNGHAAPEYGNEAARLFADKLAAGEVPGVRTIRATLHVGQPKAMQIRDYLAVLASR